MSVLSVSALMGKDKEVASILDESFEIVNFSGSEGVLGCGDDEEMGFFDLFKVDGFLIESDLGVTHSYLVALLVFLQEFLEVRTRIAHLLLARVEYYLESTALYHLLSTHLLSFQIYYLKFDEL